MPSAADTLLFSPDCRVTLTALKWSAAVVRFGSLVAATTVRVIADGAGVVWATPGAGSTIAPSNIIPIVLNCMPPSQFKGSSNHHTLSRQHTARQTPAPRWQAKGDGYLLGNP